MDPHQSRNNVCLQGVNLDDFPTAGGFRERAAEYYLNQPDAFWKEKGLLQVCES